MAGSLPRTMKTPKLHPCRPSKSEDACLHYDSIVALHSRNHGGVVPVDNQIEMVPASQPQRGTPAATDISDPEHVAGKGQSRVTSYNLNLGDIVRQALTNTCYLAMA